MDYLDSDRQTFNDLSIVDNACGEKTLFSVFHQTASDGGKRCMEEWITQPLCELEPLKERIEAIRYPNFPELRICREELDFIEFYLSKGDRPTSVSPLNSFFSHLLRRFRNKSELYIISRGVKLLEELLVDLRFFADNVTSSSPALVRRFADSIREMLRYTELKYVLSPRGKSFRYYRVDYSDYLFRYLRIGAVNELLAIVYQMDAIRTAHQVAVSRGWCYPELNIEGRFSLGNFFHPHLIEAVKNDWEMDSDSNICIFTGSNMAGKSTTLKAIASAVWLAHAGLPVPASSMICPLFDGIFTSINLPDSLRDGRSHFYTEVLRVKEILIKMGEGKRYFILFDEMFRGMNAHDAFEASEAVIDVLKNKGDSHFLISTHIIELARQFREDKNCCFRYLESFIEDDRLVCHHKVKVGMSESRVGYWIVKKELEGL